MPPLYVLSFQRSKLENAYLSSVSPAEDLLTMSQNLDLMSSGPSACAKLPFAACL